MQRCVHTYKCQICSGWRCLNPPFTMEHGIKISIILDRYTDYVVKKYGKATVVFDGYNGASTKDMAHRRRAKGKKGPTVSFTVDMSLTRAKDLFLSDSANKQQFLLLLGQHLQVAGCEVFHASSDADFLIVNKAIESSTTKGTVLVGDDNDLLVLSLFHQKTSNHSLFFAPEPKKNAKQRIWDIKKVQGDLGIFTCKHILFLHAFLDIAIIWDWKGFYLKKFKVNPILQQAAKVFDQANATPEDIEAAGEKAFVAIYNGKKKRFLEHVALDSIH